MENFEVVLVALEASRHHAHESDTVAVVGVHVGVDLEDEASELLLGRLDAAFHRVATNGRRGNLDETVQQFLHAKIVQGRAEEHRADVAFQIGFAGEVVIHTLHEFGLIAQSLGILANHLVQLGVVEVVESDAFGDVLLVGIEEIQALVVDAIHALELRSTVDGPAQRRQADVQFLLDFVQQLERIHARAVHLVDEHNDGCIPHAAHLDQLLRLRLDAFGRVDDHDDAVDSRQSAEGVFGEVLVARGVQDVDLDILIIKAHDRGSHRDATLALDLHPVGSGGLADLVRLHGTGHLDGAAVEQQFLGQCGLTRIGVADDGEGPPSVNFIDK